MAHVRFCRRVGGREATHLAGQERRLGEQRCAECNTFTCRIGLGGNCPDCEAVIVLTDLIDGDL